MSNKIVKIGKALKTVTKEEKNRREFVKACERLKKKHAKINDIRFKILKTCLREMNEIGIPVTTEEKELMANAIQLYDKTLQELKDDANRFRGYLEL